MRAFEFKWNKKNTIAPRAFRHAYPHTPFTTVGVENGYMFVTLAPDDKLYKT